MTRGAAGAARPAPPPGVRVVLDARPLQDPARAPVTAAVLGALLAAYDADPVDGESFTFLIRTDLDDPTTSLRSLVVAGRRRLPPSSLLRSGAGTVDPFLLRASALGSTWRARHGGAHGAAYHLVGGGSLPIASGLPVVVTLLDLAPWELSEAFTASPAARFALRLRTQQLREADVVIVGTEAVARAARRRLRLVPERVRVVGFAPRAGFRLDRGGAGEPDPIIAAVGLEPGRYLVYPGRYDIRQDLTTLLRALARLAATGRPVSLPEAAPWPPRVLFAGASPDDRASLARAAAREGVGDVISYSPPLSDDRLAAVLRGSRAALLPVVSEATGLAAIESVATGTPVIASAVGALPELVGPAGVLVEPRDVERLAVALRTIWTDDALRDRVAAAARERTTWDRRTWADVADGTRRIYAEVGSWPAS